MTGRLQKKCFIASVGFHLLLVVILFVGPAFVSSGKKPDPIDPIAFVPSILVEQAISGGGSPQPQPAPHLQPSLAPQPAPPKVQPRVPEAIPEEKPAPRVKPVEPPKSVARDPEAVSTKPAPKKLPNVSVTQVTRPKNSSKSKAQPANDSTASRDAVDERAKRMASAFKAAADAVREGVSGATTVQMNGPGGGGPTYASYNAEIARIYKERYDLALVSAGDIAEDQKLEVVATVTIARSGDVISARVSNPSPSRALNQLVQRVLDSIKFLREFPAEAKDQQRTLNILFDLKPKKAIG